MRQALRRVGILAHPQRAFRHGVEVNSALVTMVSASARNCCSHNLGVMCKICSDATHQRTVSILGSSGTFCANEPQAVQQESSYGYPTGQGPIVFSKAAVHRRFLAPGSAFAA